MAFVASLSLGAAQNFPLHVGGAWRDGSGGRRDVLSPATGKVIETVADATAEDVDRACRGAAEALPGWAATDGAERARLLRRLADIIASRIQELAALESRITGRPIREMRAQMTRIPEWLEYFAGIVLGLEGEANRVKGGFLTYTQYRPYGVCALLTPWNHPVLILVKKLAAALAAGNTVVIKPSELAPVSPLIIAEWAVEAGIPAGVVNVVTGAAEAGAALVANPHVARIDLTGGTGTGRRVAAAAADRLVPCTLELGGKTPVLVFEDAEQGEAVAGALFSAFVAAGQTCVSGARFLVQRSVYDRFLDEFARRVGQLRLGDPADMATDVGPVISGASRDRCMSFIEEARTDGAPLVAGGKLPTLADELSGGFFVPPTVFADVSPGMRLFRDEVFGPVVGVTPFADEHEAVSLANDSPFALGASIWTRDVLRGHRVAGQLRAGVTWINDHHKNDPRSIWGGFAASGYGKENGWDALKSYMTKGSVVVRTQERFDDWFAGGQRYG
ncbi:aldehyde dehydrogenase family protein [Mesorhizobium sp. BAC0120]|uniref:aldehyde dehydrogenase family protein n=1 Tax=Mesorhizobium sp. BAC0120 TaxID=3090670 RepID=UPI00298D07A6|nr:aldehyde dehydrogenase family protein [Mesorhizobium sp. BAC0120]MDW6023223.1 aldehyde dehydrogenase family protein [Mesorhizobium sp. BAC0120]